MTPRPNVTHIDDGCIVQLDPTRKTGFLNQKNRKFILNEWDSSGNSARQRRYRIRQQFMGGLRDLFYLSLLPEDDRDRILSDVISLLPEDDRDRDDRDRILSDVKEDRNVSDSGHNLLATIFQELYTGLNRAVFEMALEDGVEAAIIASRVDAEGVYPDINPRLEIEEGDFGDFDVDEMLRRIREGDTWPRVDREHVNRLYEAGLISEAEYSELRGSTRRMMSDEEQRLFELEREEEQLKAAKIWKNHEGSWSVNDVLFLRDQDYLTSEEASAILDGGDDHYGFRYVAHCLRCAYEGEGWERSVPGAEHLPESAADVTIKSWYWVDELSKWHRASEGNPLKKQIETAQREDEEGEMTLLSRCLDFEAPDKSPSVVGEDLSMPMLPPPDSEPDYDSEDFPSPDELTPTHIEALYENGILSEDRYHELLRDRLELAPDLLSDDQVRTLFAVGEIRIEKVSSVLDPRDLSEGYIVELKENDRITHQQYLDMLTLKYRQEGKMSLSTERVQELLKTDRIDPDTNYVDSGQLVELLQMGAISPERYLDILEERFEENPESLFAEDLWDLLRSERISEEAYLAADQSWEDVPADLPPEEERESIQEMYGQ